MRAPMACPYCGGSVPGDTTVCPDCHEDLAALVRLTLEHAIYYNEGLAAAQGGDLDAARIKLLCALEHRPRFLPALVLLAKVAAARQDWALARRTAAQALEVAPDDGRVRRTVAAIEAAALREEPARRRPSRTPSPGGRPQTPAAERRRSGLFGAIFARRARGDGS